MICRNPLLEIFRLNEKGCPAEKIELKNRSVKAVSVEFSDVVCG